MSSIRSYAEAAALVEALGKVAEHRDVQLVVGPWRDTTDLRTVRLGTCFDFPLNIILNGGHWSREELRWLLREWPALAARLEAADERLLPAQRARLLAVPPEEADAWSDWSSVSDSDPEDTAARAAMLRGAKKGAKKGGKMGSREDKSRAGKLGGKRSGAARRAKAAAAGGLREDLGPEELAELALKMAMERLVARGWKPSQGL
jgi:hypothetical protein